MTDKANVPDQAVDALLGWVTWDSDLSVRDRRQESREALEYVAPYIEAHLCRGLITAFTRSLEIREASGDPAARGIKHCIDHISAVLACFEREVAEKESSEEIVDRNMRLSDPDRHETWRNVAMTDLLRKARRKARGSQW